MSIFNWKSRKAAAPAAAPPVVPSAPAAVTPASPPAPAEPEDPAASPVVPEPIAVPERQAQPDPIALAEAGPAESAAPEAEPVLAFEPEPEPEPEVVPEPEPVAAPKAPVEPEAAAEPDVVAEPQPAADRAGEQEADVAPAAPVADPAPATLEAPPAIAAAPEFSLLTAIDQVMAEPPAWPEAAIPEPPRPNDSIEATLTLTRHGQPAMELPVSAEMLGSIIDNLPDHQSLEDFYDLAAEHPSAQVRLAVARKDRLGEDAVRKLAEAREFYVLERLLASDQFRAQVSQDRLLAIMELHPELARDVAGNYASYLNCAAGALLATLGSHRDPGVRLALVENYSASAALLRRFATDPDPGVRAAARRRLTEA